jgi:hypothetical protein
MGSPQVFVSDVLDWELSLRGTDVVMLDALSRVEQHGSCLYMRRQEAYRRSLGGFALAQCMKVRVVAVHLASAICRDGLFKVSSGLGTHHAQAWLRLETPSHQ